MEICNSYPIDIPLMSIILLTVSNFSTFQMAQNHSPGQAGESAAVWEADHARLEAVVRRNEPQSCLVDSGSQYVPA